MKRGSNLELELDWGLPCPRIFENSQKKSKAGADQEEFRKWQAIKKKKSGIFAIL